MLLNILQSTAKKDRREVSTAAGLRKAAEEEPTRTGSPASRNEHRKKNKEGENGAMG